MNTFNLILKFIDGTKEVLPVDLLDENDYGKLSQDLKDAFLNKTIWSYVDVGVDFASIAVYMLREVVKPAENPAPAQQTPVVNQSPAS